MASKWIAEKMGDMVEDAVKKALGMDEKEKDKDEGGIFSKIFNRDDDDDDHKKKSREKDEDDKKENFFTKIFDRDDDDDDKKKESKSGFSGLFSELEGVSPPGGEGMGGGGGGGGGMNAQSVQVNDGDLFDDLMDVAKETSGGK